MISSTPPLSVSGVVEEQLRGAVPAGDHVVGHALVLGRIGHGTPNVHPILIFNPSFGPTIEIKTVRDPDFWLETFVK